MFKFVVAAILAVSVLAQDNCPKNYACKWDQKACPMGGPGPDGCPPPTYCIQSKTPSSKYGFGMCEASCPSSCGEGQMSCPQGEDSMGCKIPDLCMPEPSPTDECPRMCPMTCRQDEIVCSGKSWDNKCPSMNYCMPKGKKVMIEYECPGFCPLDCNPDEIQCPGQRDQYGCESPGYCIPMFTYNINGTKDACPNQCPTAPCRDNEIMCPGAVDSNGCRMMDTCMPRMMGNNNQLCYGSCPVTCQPGEMMCSTMDPNGCMMQSCVPLTTPSIDPTITCANFCPVMCPPDYFQCSGPADQYGCKGMDSCVPFKTGYDGIMCPNTCPTTCNNGDIPCPSKWDSNGCEIMQGCAKDPSQCPQ